MLPDCYTDQYLHIVDSKMALSRSTGKALKSMFRRLAAGFDKEDLRRPEVVLMFRQSVPRGTRSVFGMTWGILRMTEAGRDIEPLQRIPVVTYPHPLYADVMHLGAVLGNERLTDLTWEQAMTAWGWDERAMEAAARIWFFFMPADSKPAKTSPLVVKDAKARPMPLWMVTYIINSPTLVHKNKKPLKEAKMVEFAEKAIAVATGLQVDSDFLKAMCQRIELVREKHNQLDIKAMMKELDAILAAKNTARLAMIINALPVGSITEEEADEAT